jgi:hypothetical protein
MRLLAIIGAVAILAVIGAAIYFFGGYYSVAAAEPNPEPRTRKCGRLPLS